MNLRCIALAAILVLAAGSARSQQAQAPADSTRPQLWVVGTAHLDTQWRWTIQQSIGEFIPETFRRNMALMDIYPDYVFSFEGAFRYMLMKEYYPDEFEKVRPYIRSGQWRVTGSWVDAVDVNVPSFESLVRQTLYGNGYFRKEFGKTSRDVFLPDCFGFGYALPSIAHHCGLESFSTQKLTWGSWIGVPFDIGLWQGVDGSTLLCGVNPGSYSAGIKDNLSRDTTWLNTAERCGREHGLYAAYHYFGTGDTGGSPDSASVALLHTSIATDGPLEVKSIGADDINDLVPMAVRPHLPCYDGEMVMTRHGVGCYTSQAAMKRWNRKNELLADAAERASVIAAGLGRQEYPRELLRDAWIRFLWHQFHDDLTGTSIPEAYEFSWNDELLCQNRFAAALKSAVGNTAAELDTRAQGVPLVVYNPLSIERQDIVEGTVHLPWRGPWDLNGQKVEVYSPDDPTGNVRVYDPDGREVPSDVTMHGGDSATVRFLAKVPATGFAVFDVRPSKDPCQLKTGLSITDRTLENSRYRVTVNDAGQVASIYDKASERELLSAPLRYEFLEDTPRNWPAWEIDYNDIMAEPLDLFTEAPVIRIVENGAARVALQVLQRTDSCILNTTIRLSAGAAGSRVEFAAEIDWYEARKMLKVAVPTTTSNDLVTYDLGLGTIARGLNFEKRYEVPGHQWADLSTSDGEYGVAVMNDCRYGWDHPDPSTLRLTLVRTPGVTEGWDWVGDERSQDQGHHQVEFAIAGHTGDWRSGAVIWNAARLNEPLTAYQAQTHKGELGDTYSLLDIRSDSDAKGAPPSVMVNAVKMAENSDEIVVRVRELTGHEQGRVTLSFNRPVQTAREVNGAEDEIGPVDVIDGKVVFKLTGYQPKAFAVTLEGSSKTGTEQNAFAPVPLPFNRDGVSNDAARCDGDFDGHGYTLAGDLLPDTIDYLGLPFVTGPKTDKALNVVDCAGQTVALPSGKYDRLYLLAAAVNGPATATFTIDRDSFPVELQDYADPIGQWNDRLADGQLVEKATGIAPGYINRLPVAWYGSHRHTPDCENDLYRFTYLFMIELPIDKGAKTLTLPADSSIRLMAATLGTAPDGDIVAIQPLYDRTRNTLARIKADSTAFAGHARLTMSTPIPAAAIFYTLDGSAPTENSERYIGPITVDATTTVKARAIKEGYRNWFVASKTVNRLELKEPTEAPELTGGLACNYYEGEWDNLPGFDTLAVVKSYVADSVVIPEIARDEDYGLVFTGYVKIPTDGIWAFSINSDDGSRLYIADTILVDNDGIHGDYEMTGLLGLKAGVYPVRAEMFQCKGGEALGVSVSGPGLPKQPIPTSMLFHEK